MCMHQMGRKVMIRKGIFFRNWSYNYKGKRRNLVVAIKEIGLELNADKPKYMVMS